MVRARHQLSNAEFIEASADRPPSIASLGDRLGATHYGFLGVSRGCDLETVRIAHLQILDVINAFSWSTSGPLRESTECAELHLDELRHAAELAFAVLSDPMRRRDYDRFLDSAQSAPGTCEAEPSPPISGEFRRVGRTPPTDSSQRSRAVTRSRNVTETFAPRTLCDPRREPE